MSGESDNRGAPGTASLALAVQGLACRRGERIVFSGLDFTARAGDVVWVRGANGSGKTTLLRTLAGIAEAAAGTFRFSGGALPQRPLYLAHANALKGDLGVAESLRFLLMLDGLAAGAPAIDQALARFGLAERRGQPVRTLSQGQARRVALARLAAQTRASAWLLDEPLDALDTAGIDALMGILLEHANRGGLVVLTSHVPLPGALLRPLQVHLDTAAVPA